MSTNTTTQDVRLPAYLFWPVLYLALLAISIVAFWWIILIGGNPVEIENVGTFDRYGEARSKFRPGELVTVRRKVCSSHALGIQFFPSLISPGGAMFALEGGFAVLQEGCRPTVYTFVVPDVDAGTYSYVSSVKFQNNLVGRDEFSVYPPLAIEVLEP